jgi:hypothetical protein
MAGTTRDAAYESGKSGKKQPFSGGPNIFGPPPRQIAGAWIVGAVSQPPLEPDEPEDCCWSEDFCWLITSLTVLSGLSAQAITVRSIGIS